MNDLYNIDWFVLRVRFQRAAIAQTRLNKPDIETYLPMEMRAIPTKCGGQCVKLAPIFADMIFLKTSFKRVSEICAAYKDMYYRSEIVDGLKRAIRIPENQMTTFREFISGNYDNIDCKITKLKSGEKIVVKSGMFKGSKVVFKEEIFDGTFKKYKVYIGNEIVELFRILEANYLDDMLIVSSDDVTDDNFTFIYTESGIFKDIPLFFENVKGVEHKCLTMNLYYGTVVAIKSLTPESFMTQRCVMRQTINGEFIKTEFPIMAVAN